MPNKGILMLGIMVRNCEGINYSAYYRIYTLELACKAPFQENKHRPPPPHLFKICWKHLLEYPWIYHLKALNKTLFCIPGTLADQRIGKSGYYLGALG